MRIHEIVTLAIAAFCCLTMTARANMNDLAEDYKSQAAQKSQELAELRASLEADQYSGSEERELDVKQYLWTELTMIHLAKMAVNLVPGNDVIATNADLNQLAALGYLPEWPANPLNNWEPTRVLNPSDDFAYGELVLSLCPASDYTTLGRVPAAAYSFELYIYGLDIEPGFDADIWSMKENQSWSQVPTGALYGMCFHTSSDAEIRRAKELTAPLIEAEKAAEAAVEASQDPDAESGSGN